MFALRERFASLDRLGIAVEYFPRYVNRRVGLHSLDVVLLSFILCGRGVHHIGDERFDETGGSLGVTHYGQCHDIITDERGMEIINVYLDLQNYPLPALPPELQPVLPRLLPLHPRFAHRLNRIVRLQFDDPAPLAQLLFSIRDELIQEAAGYAEAAMLQWKLFLIRCCRQALASGFVRPSILSRHPHQAMEQLRSYLDAAYAQPHRLVDLARRARMNPTALCRAFKRYTGKRLFDYLIDRRIQSAMLLLRGGEDKILSVAAESGFADLAYFNRTFKRIVGLTPTAYRKANRSG